ncbi:TIR domain-containing protein [Caenimonas terrae]|uniref:TIR domain-containing protein n=1 Tax=Caenimonas terrae TaxID=696074 RepID=A0ABW0NCX3_9BURK
MAKEQTKSPKQTPAPKAAAKKATPIPSKAPDKPRSYMSQEDIPAYGIDDALLVARAILEQYGGDASTPLDVAAALEMQTTSSKFRMLCGASIAYGLTTGGYNAQSISVTELARRIIEPTEEGDDLVAKREAVLKPRIIREFLSKYSGSQLPREEIGFNVLKGMKVPADRAQAVWEMIISTANSVGFIRIIKDRKYADLGGVKPPQTSEPTAPESNASEKARDIPEPFDDAASEGAVAVPPAPAPATTDPRSRKVFITHGKNTSFIEPIKKLLGFGEMIPVVSVEKQSVAQPVPDKVMNDMRACGAAIIHVEGEMVLIDKDAKEHTVINPNVLIEIGAAMALYGRRFILLVRDGVKLPSNLQGLYEVRYQGDSLDGNTTIKLLEAINEMKSTPPPEPA